MAADDCQKDGTRKEKRGEGKKATPLTTASGTTNRDDRPSLVGPSWRFYHWGNLSKPSSLPPIVDSARIDYVHSILKNPFFPHRYISFLCKQVA